MSCSNEVSVSVVVVEFSTRTLNTVLRDHFLFYFVLLLMQPQCTQKFFFFCSLVFFPKNPSFFQSVEYRVKESTNEKRVH